HSTAADQGSRRGAVPDDAVLDRTDDRVQSATEETGSGGEVGEGRSVTGAHRRLAFDPAHRGCGRDEAANGRAVARSAGEGIADTDFANVSIRQAGPTPSIFQRYFAADFGAGT